MLHIKLELIICIQLIQRFKFMLRKLSLPGPTNLLPTQFADPVGRLFESEVYGDSQYSHQWSHNLM